ncbi:uncharacterized protein LOC112565776 [Pomacea canaliculata]|uniref:uncharacterized protein LOC112565776 n=1 Tax=Pomacea canaliculata TaxID=400727 RepID=UPI000D737627|nr:uncharacterized protein LOC112565776 [Pomacea canaliculata]
MLRFFLFILSLSPGLLANDAGRCQGEVCMRTKWHNISCTTDDDCDQPFTVCYKHQCRCEAGLFYTTHDTCTSSCSTDELQNNFTEYPDSGIGGDHLASSDGVSLQDCKDRCLADKRCLTFDFEANGGLCRLHNVTAFESHSHWHPSTSKGWTHYQRSCKSTFASQDNWHNLLCNSKMDCPGPNNDCLSGRCMCNFGFKFDENQKDCRVTRSCRGWQGAESKSGVYHIHLPYNKGHRVVWCDMESGGGGWLVFQRRRDFSVDFDRNWTEYEQGFGDIHGDFWLGLSTLHIMTRCQDVRLRVDIMDIRGRRYWAEYSVFQVLGPDTSYRLFLLEYSGDAGDWMASNNGKEFVTYDRNKYGCANCFDGAWWYPSGCGATHLNGVYVFGNQWNRIYPLALSEMKLKAK